MGDTNSGTGNTSIWGAIGSMGSGLLGMIGQRKRSLRQMRHQRELMGLQYENQRKLNTQGQQLQKQTWEETNPYGAEQMKMMKDQGWNPSLLYGGSGAGGTTTGSQGGGSAASGNAPNEPPMAMDIAQITNSAIAAAEIGLKKAQKENIEADTEKKKGVDTAEAETRIQKLIADIANVEAKTILTEYQQRTENQRSGLVMQEAVKASEEVVRMARENDIGEETKQQIIEGIGQDLINKQVEERLNEVKINLNEQQREVLEHKIYQEWVKTGSMAVGSLGLVISNAIKKLGKK